MYAGGCTAGNVNSGGRAVADGTTSINCVSNRGPYTKACGTELIAYLLGNARKEEEPTAQAGASGLGK